VTNSPSDLAGDDQFSEHERDERRDSGRAAAAATEAADALSCEKGRRVLVIDAHLLRQALRPRSAVADPIRLWPGGARRERAIVTDVHGQKSRRQRAGR
jgi:hypothetical protein